MKREDKVISHELAKQIQEDHFRIGIKAPESEYWWWDGTGEAYELIRYDSLEYCDRKESKIHGYPAYDVAELGQMLPDRIEEDKKVYHLIQRVPERTWFIDYYYDPYGEMPECLSDGADERPMASDIEAESRGYKYLWLLKEGYIK